MADWDYEGNKVSPYGSYGYHNIEWQPPPPRQPQPPFQRPLPPYERPLPPHEEPPPPPPPPPRKDFYHEEHGRGYGRYSPPPPPPPPPRNSPSSRGFETSPRGRGAPHPRNLHHQGNKDFRGRGSGGFRGHGLPRGGCTPRGNSIQRGNYSPRGPVRGQSVRGCPAMRGVSSPRGAQTLAGGGQTIARGRASPRGQGRNRGGPHNRGGFISNGQVQGNSLKDSGPKTNDANNAGKDTSAGSVSLTSQSVKTTVPNEKDLQVTTSEPVAPFSYQSLAQANAKKKLNEDDKATAPGQANFISFKNSLQEFCQKRHMPVPSYSAFRNSFGYSSKVEVAGQVIQSNAIQREKKDAEQNAAYEALKTLGLIPANVQFTTKPPPAKRPSFEDEDFGGKKMKVDLCSNMSFKSQLNEFCQKFRLPVPSYEAVKSEKGFICTLIYNKKVYQSITPQKNKKLAEQNAAQVVLHKLGQAPAPEPSLEDAIQKCAELCSKANVSSTSANTGQKELNLSTATSTTLPVKQGDSVPPINPTLPTVSSMQGSTENQGSLINPNTAPHVSYKNQLQEFCQKNKLELPQYHSVHEKKSFTCTVHVAGKCFESTGCKTKKGSEQSVARVALQAMGLLQQNQV